MNTNIALGIQRPRFNTGEEQRNALAIQNAQQQQQMNALAMQGQQEDRVLKRETMDFERQKYMASLDDKERARVLGEVDTLVKVAPLLMNPETYGQGYSILQQTAPGAASRLPAQFSPEAVPAIESMAIGAKGMREQANADRTYEQKERELKAKPTHEQRMAERAAGRTSITVDNAGPKEHEKLDAKYYQDLYMGTQKAERSSERQAMDYGLIDKLIGEAYSGAGAQQVQSAKKAAKILGIDVGDVSGPEAAAMISNELALKLRSPDGGAGMPGAMSDADRQFLSQMVPGLTTTPEGRKVMIEVQKRIAKRNREVAKDARDYRLQNRYLDINFEQQIADKYGQNNLFDGLEVPGQSAQPEGEIFEDAQGNRARQVNGEWVPL